MTKALTGFVADSGVQQHSAGKHFPITEYTVGGWPPNEVSGKAFFVAVAPCGTRKRSWTLERHKACMETFVEAYEATKGLDTNVVDERIAFELALLSLQNRGRWAGFSFKRYSK